MKAQVLRLSERVCIVRTAGLGAQLLAGARVGDARVGAKDNVRWEADHQRMELTEEEFNKLRTIMMLGTR